MGSVYFYTKKKKKSNILSRSVYRKIWRDILLYRRKKLLGRPVYKVIWLGRLLNRGNNGW